MALISEAELTSRIKKITVDRTFQALLLNSTGRLFSAVTPYTTLVQYEVAGTAGGYERLEFSYTNADVNLNPLGASTITKYITWVHNGNANPIKFDTILFVERIFAQPLPQYNVVAIHSLGLINTLNDSGDRARFAFRVNLKNI